MVARVFSACLSGLDAQQVTVEVDLNPGLPGLHVVGLPDTIVNESRERLKSALKNNQFDFPLKKVVINLAPASIKKEGAGLDLPLALGTLLASEQLPSSKRIESTLFVGELSLEGLLRPVRGALSLAILAKEAGFSALVLPKDNAKEACLVEGLDIYGLSSMADLKAFLSGSEEGLMAFQPGQLLKAAQFDSSSTRKHNIDFADIKGQFQAKRALEIAAAGGHNVILSGSPGSGKSMLAKAFSGILPPMSLSEVLEVSRIYSVAGLLPKENGLICERPFRSPHHSASMAGLTGGGSTPKPGEITLSHRGVLFLDELVEFPRPVIEVLRQPLEDGEVTISRATQNFTFPASFTLFAAINPCPCGFLGDTEQACTCNHFQIERYRGKLSGPLLDRIDIQLEVPRLSNQDLLNDHSDGVESSAQVRERVIQARQIQQERFASLSLPFLSNSEISPSALKRICVLDLTCKQFMKKALDKLNLSARAYDRLLKVSRTIADLDAAETIQIKHLSEALQYRGLYRSMRNSHSKSA